MSKDGKCIIVGAGDFTEKILVIGENDYLIAADGGYEYIKRLGLTPDIVLGDFDSLDIIPDHKNVVKYPVIKDDTDMMLAVKTGIKLGYNKYDIYGGLGGKRLDHTLANLQTLSYLSELGAECNIFSSDTVVTAITDTSIEFDESFRGIISVFCFCGKAEEVTIKGLKYETSNSLLTSSFPLGVSNEFIGTASSVTVGKGTLIILYQRQRK